MDYLNFEQPIADLDKKIQELKQMGNTQDINITEEVLQLQEKCDALSTSIFKNLTPQQTVQVARHPMRPYTLDYIERILTDFEELHGDRHSSDAAPMVTGIGRLNDKPVAVVGHQKGRSTKQKVTRNFGMASPAGFRKALRVFKLAEKFKLPIITFIDTPGAYPGIQAEENNQSEAIARNLFEMSRLKTPIISIVTGEGCSGGALGIGVSDVILMLQYSYYSVISPEGCASILWKDAEKAPEAALQMGITAPRLKELGLIDEILTEPLGGAHRDFDAIAETVKEACQRYIDQFSALSTEQLLQHRADYWLDKGQL